MTIDVGVADEVDSAPIMNDPLAPGTKLGKYELVRLIGEGGMGSVYKALHGELGKHVAIKMLLPAIAANPAARARFLREGQASSRIRHPHVVDVTDVESHQDMPYLVMEYLEGETLADLFSREGALAIDHLLDLMLPVLSAVGAGHDAGVVHRDLKPQNIFLARERRETVPKVLDFGISKFMSADGSTGTGRAVTATGVSFGTVAYMSPEQAGGAKNADARSDQYSLGLILYEGATGRRAHEADNVFALLRQIADGSVPSPRALRPELPLPFEQALLRALAPKPEHRYESVTALGQALLPFASARGHMMHAESFLEAHPGVPEPARRAHPATEKLPPTTLRSAASVIAATPPPRRRTALVIGGAALLIVAGAIAVRQLGPAEAPPAAARAPALPPTAAIPPPPVVAPPAPVAEPAPVVPPSAVTTAPPVVEPPRRRRPRPPKRTPEATASKEPARPAPKEPARPAPKTGTNNAIILP